MTDERDNPGINVPPPLIYVAPLLLGLVLDRRRHLPFLPRGMARALGVSLVGGGAVLNVWFLRTIRKADVPLRTDKPVPRLATQGPFRYSRNPSYMALAMIYAGIAVLRNSLWAMLLLPLVVMVMQREVIGREERYLERAFGEEYLTYRGKVRRWVQIGKPPDARHWYQQRQHALGLARFVGAPWPAIFSGGQVTIHEVLDAVPHRVKQGADHQSGD